TDFLDYLRESVMLKVEGLSEADARKPLVASGTSLLGLVEHLIGAEVEWFDFKFLGRPPQDPFEPEAVDTTVAGWIGRYERAASRSNEIVTSAVSLDAPLQMMPQVTLRWLLVHMI